MPKPYVSPVWVADQGDGTYKNPILYADYSDPDVIRVGAGYTRIVYGGSATIFLLFVLNAVFRGSGDAAVAMRSLWLANGINILLNPLLIFGLGPFPELGVAGSAVGTIIGRGSGVLYQLYILFSGGGRVPLKLSDLRLVPDVMKKLVALSLGGMFQYIVPMGSWTVLIRMAATFGTSAVAGYGLAVRIIIFVILPSWGFSNAAATLVGQNLGAGEPRRGDEKLTSLRAPLESARRGVPAARAR